MHRLARFMLRIVLLVDVAVGLAGPPRRNQNTRSVRVLVSWNRHAPAPDFHVADEFANRNLIGAVLDGSSVDAYKPMKSPMSGCGTPDQLSVVQALVPEKFAGSAQSVGAG